AELRVSDHRPVMSSFDIEVIKCDEAAKKKIQGELYVAKQKTMSRSIEKQTALSILESVEKTVHSISGNGEKQATRSILGNGEKQPSRSQFNDVIITNGDNELGKANYARKYNNPPNDHQDNIITADNSNISKETGPAVGLLINVDESNKKEECDSSSPMVVDKSVINRKYRNFSSNPFYELNPRLIRSLSLKPLIPSKSTTSKSVIRHNSLGSILRTNNFTEDDDEFLAKAPKFGDLTSSAQRDVHKAFENNQRLPESTQKARICYARVSSEHQQGDLERQIVELQHNYPRYEIISNISLELNWKCRDFLFFWNEYTLKESKKRSDICANNNKT
ncbi:19009_t:CDS:2, partial [Gigaspora rosea]